jgi:uncharacterized membrane protein
LYLIARYLMKMSSDTRRAISVILFYTALLFFLVGMAARLKSDFHARAEISTAGFIAAAVLAAFGLIAFLFSWGGKTDSPAEPPL